MHLAGRAALVALLLSSALPSHAQEPAAAGVSRWRQLEALWYREGEPGKPRVYGTTKIRATVTPNPEREVRVGVFEEYAGATGAQWRSSVWIASFVGSLLLGRDLTEARFDIAAGGYIDGPSAGGLMAVGFIAAMTGDEIRPEASMTGALAPDGSIGPVGGVPEKIEAARAVKKTLVGIPKGQRICTGPDGKKIDVVELGKSYGIEVRELSDIYEAYELLTGKEFARPTAVAAEKMAVPGSMQAALKARAVALLEQAASDLKLVGGDKSPGVPRAVARAKAELAAGMRYLDKANVSSAYLRGLRAASMARAAARTAALGGDEKYAPVAGSLENTDNEVERVEKELEKLQQSGTAKPLTLLAGFGAAARARGFLELARAMLQRAVQAFKGNVGKAIAAIRASGRAFLPALYLTYADQALDLARELLRMPAAGDVPLVLDETALLRSTRGFVSAASGNVEYIDALLLADVAKERKVPIDDVRVAFGQNERSYLLASQLAQIAIQAGVDGKGQTAAKAMMRLQSAINSYVESAAVITKYYSLETGEEGKAAKVRRIKALNALVRRAEVAAREAAAVAEQRLGVIPPDAQLYYRAGLQEAAAGTDRGKLRALRDFWRSSVLSRSAAMTLKKGEAPAAPSR